MCMFALLDFGIFFLLFMFFCSEIGKTSSFTVPFSGKCSFSRRQQPGRVLERHVRRKRIFQSNQTAATV